MLGIKKKLVSGVWALSHREETDMRSREISLSESAKLSTFLEAGYIARQSPACGASSAEKTPCVTRRNASSSRKHAIPPQHQLSHMSTPQKSFFEQNHGAKTKSRVSTGFYHQWHQLTCISRDRTGTAQTAPIMFCSQKQIRRRTSCRGQPLTHRRRRRQS